MTDLEILSQWTVPDIYYVRIAILKEKNLIRCNNLPEPYHLERIRHYISSESNRAPEIFNTPSDPFEIDWINGQIHVSCNGEIVRDPTGLVSSPFAFSFLGFADLYKGMFPPFIQMRSADWRKNREQGLLSYWVALGSLEKFGFHLFPPMNGKEYLRWATWEASLLSSLVRELWRPGTLLGLSQTSLPGKRLATLVLPYLYPDGSIEKDSYNFIAQVGFNIKYGFEILINGTTVNLLDTVSLHLACLTFDELAFLKISDDGETYEPTVYFCPNFNFKGLLNCSEEPNQLGDASKRADLAEFFGPMPLTDFGLRYAAATRTLCFMLICFHEEAHLRLGHSLDALTREVPLFEIPIADLSEEISSIFLERLSTLKVRLAKRNISSHIMESYCDIWSFLEFLETIIQSKVAFSFSSDDDTSLGIFIHVLADTIASFFLTTQLASESQDTLKDHELLSSTHPPAPTRLLLILSTLRLIVKTKKPSSILPLWFDSGQFNYGYDDKFLEILNIVVYGDQILSGIFAKCATISHNYLGSNSFVDHFKGIIHDLLSLDAYFSGNGRPSELRTPFGVLAVEIIEISRKETAGQKIASHAAKMSIATTVYSSFS